MDTIKHEESLMLRHVVLRSFTAGATPQDVAAVEANTRRFLEVEGVMAVHIGPNLDQSPRAEGLEHVTMIDLEDANALRRLVTSEVRTQAVAFAQPLTQRAVVAEIEL